MGPFDISCTYIPSILSHTDNWDPTVEGYPHPLKRSVDRLQREAPNFRAAVDRVEFRVEVFRGIGVLGCRV